LSQGYEIHPFRETSIDDKCDRCHDDREDDQVTTNCEPALLLIAHGTRDPRGAAEMATLVDHLRERIAAPVGAAWLEDFAEPDAVTATGALVDAGAEALVTLPLLNFGAMHAKTDVPGDVVDIRARFPDLPVAHGRVLDIHPALLALARDRVAAVSPADERGDEVLMVTGAGSSDPDANGGHRSPLGRDRLRGGQLAPGRRAARAARTRRRAPRRAVLLVTARGVAGATGQRLGRRGDRARHGRA
jgi:sirohydrochlorin ferrochelatase